MSACIGLAPGMKGKAEDDVQDFTLDHSHHGSERRQFALSDNARGALVVLGASVALIAIAYAAMIAISGPDGWATRAAGSAYAGDVSLVSGPMPAGIGE